MKRGPGPKADPEKTHEWQQRSRKNLSRKTPMQTINRERKQRRKEADEVYGSYFQWAKGWPCRLVGNPAHACRGPLDPHHVKSVGAGGKDANNLVTLCRGAHDEVHSIGPSRWEARWGLDLDLEAGVMWAAYCDAHPAERGESEAE